MRTFLNQKKLVVNLRCQHSKVLSKREALGVHVGSKLYCAHCGKDSMVMGTQWVNDAPRDPT